MARRANESVEDQVIENEDLEGYDEPRVGHQSYDAAPKELKDLPKFSDVNQIVSPLVKNDDNDGLRKREGWHQTWKRDDEFRDALEAGYRQIRKSAPGKKQPAGQETGPVIVKADGEKHDIIAMEIPQEYYIAHINAIAAQSHRSYNDPDLVLQNFANKTGRDLGSRKEQIHLSVNYEAQREELR